MVFNMLAGLSLGQSAGPIAISPSFSSLTNQDGPLAAGTERTLNNPDMEESEYRSANPVPEIVEERLLYEDLLASGPRFEWALDDGLGLDKGTGAHSTHTAQVDEPVYANSHDSGIDKQWSTIGSILKGELGEQTQFRVVTLDDAISIALNDASVLRSLNATVVSSPQLVASSLDPGIQKFDPIRGYDAALSAFDPVLSSTASYAKNDDVFNNPVLGSGANEIRDDVLDLDSGVTKTGRFGTQFLLRSNIQNSDSNNPSLLFGDSWTTELEGTIRQPLLQGRGVVNQILGPNAQPGAFNNRGILLAIADVDIAKSEFLVALRGMIQEIVEAYWELNLAYRRLEASSEVRALAYQTWKAAEAKFEQGLVGGAADDEALARDQYYRLSAQVNADLRGDGSDGQTGVLQAEANLRRLLGVGKEIDTILYAADSPLVAPIKFDSDHLESQAVSCRQEIAQQSARVHQLETELSGLQNLTLPRLDLLLTLRNNGFGDDLAGGGPRFASAFQDANSGDHLEYEVGVSYEVPFGVRQAKAAVSHAQLRISRERAILWEQQEQIRFEVRRSLLAYARHQKDLMVQSNRVEAAQAATDARLAAFETGVVTIDEILIVQQRLLEAKRAYFASVLSLQRSLVELDVQSGKLLREYGVGVIDTD